MCMQLKLATTRKYGSYLGFVYVSSIISVVDKTHKQTHTHILLLFIVSRIHA